MWSDAVRLHDWIRLAESSSLSSSFAMETGSTGGNSQVLLGGNVGEVVRKSDSRELPSLRGDILILGALSQDMNMERIRKRGQLLQNRIYSSASSLLTGNHLLFLLPSPMSFEGAHETLRFGRRQNIVIISLLLLLSLYPRFSLSLSGSREQLLRNITDN